MATKTKSADEEVWYPQGLAVVRVLFRKVCSSNALHFAPPAPPSAASNQALQ